MTAPLTPEQAREARKLGAIAYAAYCQASSGRSLATGAPLPRFDELGADLQRAWMMSGVVVAMYHTEELRRGMFA
ncbi:MAG TPA: hypothetical protein VLI45_09250 [Acidobacteriaceae bacterium]|nr:hypothetical protein [Acidobacteriaceae bacterium]